MQLSMYVRLSCDMRFSKLVSGTLGTEHRVAVDFFILGEASRFVKD